MEPSAPMAGDDSMGAAAASGAPYDWFAKNVQSTRGFAARPGAKDGPLPASRPVRSRLPRYSGHGEVSRPDSTGGGTCRLGSPLPVCASASRFACVLVRASDAHPADARTPPARMRRAAGAYVERSARRVVDAARCLPRQRPGRVSAHVALLRRARRREREQHKREPRRSAPASRARRGAAQRLPRRSHLRRYASCIICEGGGAQLSPMKWRDRPDRAYRVRL